MANWSITREQNKVRGLESSEIWEERRAEGSPHVNLLSLLASRVIGKRGNLMVANPLLQDTNAWNSRVDVVEVVDQRFDVAAEPGSSLPHQGLQVTPKSISTILRDFAPSCIGQQGQGWGLV